MNLQTVTKDLCDLLQSENGCQYTDVSDGQLRQINDVCTDPINILHLNIQSFQHNKDALVLLLNDLQENNIIVHVIGLCETFLTDQSKGTAHIENYSAIHSCRSEKIGGGTTLLIHDSVRLVKDFPVAFTDNFESTSALVEYKGKQFFISEFYRPSNSNESCFMDSLGKILSLSKNYKQYFLCSDQNFDLLKTSHHKPTRDFLSLMLDFEFVPYMQKPTRVTHKSSTLIDNIYVKASPVQKNCSFYYCGQYV